MLFVMTKKRRLQRMFNWAVKQAGKNDANAGVYRALFLTLNEAILYLDRLEEK